MVGRCRRLCRHPQGRPRRHARPDGDRRPGARRRPGHPAARPPGADRQGLRRDDPPGQHDRDRRRRGRRARAAGRLGRHRRGARAAVAALTGDLQQVPSAVSAIKVDGVRSYARVRAGEQVELAARSVTVSRFEVLARRGDRPRRRRRLHERHLRPGAGPRPGARPRRRWPPDRAAAYPGRAVRPRAGPHPGAAGRRLGGRAAGRCGGGVLPAPRPRRRGGGRAVVRQEARAERDARDARGPSRPDGRCIALLEDRDAAARPDGGLRTRLTRGRGTLMDRRTTPALLTALLLSLGAAACSDDAPTDRSALPSPSASPSPSVAAPTPTAPPTPTTPTAPATAAAGAEGGVVLGGTDLGVTRLGRPMDEAVRAVSVVLGAPDEDPAATTRCIESDREVRLGRPRPRRPGRPAGRLAVALADAADAVRRHRRHDPVRPAPGLRPGPADPRGQPRQPAVVRRRRRGRPRCAVQRRGRRGRDRAAHELLLRPLTARPGAAAAWQAEQCSAGGESRARRPAGGAASSPSASSTACTAATSRSSARRRARPRARRPERGPDVRPAPDRGRPPGQPPADAHRTAAQGRAARAARRRRHVRPAVHRRPSAG